MSDGDSTSPPEPADYEVEVQIESGNPTGHKYFSGGETSPSYTIDFRATSQGIEVARRTFGDTQAVAQPGTLYAPNEGGPNSWRLTFKDPSGKPAGQGTGTAEAQRTVRVGARDLRCVPIAMTIEWTAPAPAREERRYCYSRELGLPVEERVEFGGGGGFVSTTEAKLRSV